MHRNWISRSLAGMLSIWLAICLAEPMQLHTCTMHGGLAIDVSPSSSQHDGTSHTVHGGYASHATAGHSDHDQGTDSQSTQCTCLGDCNAGKSPIGLAAAYAVMPALPTTIAGAVFTYESPALAAPHFLIPFSNGPP